MKKQDVMFFLAVFVNIILFLILNYTIVVDRELALATALACNSLAFTATCFLAAYIRVNVEKVEPRRKKSKKSRPV